MEVRAVVRGGLGLDLRQAGATNLGPELPAAPNLLFLEVVDYSVAVCHFDNLPTSKSERLSNVKEKMHKRLK